MTNKGRMGFGALTEILCQKNSVWLNRHTRAPAVVPKVKPKLRHRNRNMQDGSPEKSLPVNSKGNNSIAHLLTPAPYSGEGRCNTHGNHHTTSAIKVASIISFKQSSNQRGLGWGSSTGVWHIQAPRGPSKCSGSLWWQVGARDLAGTQIALEQVSSLHPPAAQLRTLGLHTTF